MPRPGNVSPANAAVLDYSISFTSTMSKDEPTPEMFFIVGRGRSGTDLLSSVLNAHPEISVAPEALFVMNLFYTFHKIKDWNSKAKNKFTRYLWGETRLTKWWHLDKDKVVEDILAQNTKASFAQLCRIPYMHYAVKHGKHPLLLGDKNPTYTLFVNEIHKIYPDARFVHVVRDYRDNVLSFKNVSFDLKNIYSLAQRWKRYNLVVKEFADHHPDLVLTVRYEDLLGHPEEVLSKICQFLGVDYDAEVLNYYQQKSGGDIWQKHLSKPIDPDQRDKWQKQLKKRDIAKIECICSKLGKDYDYEPVHQSFPLSVKMLSLKGLLVGKAANFLERNFFRLPCRVTEFLLKRYRRATLTDTIRQQRSNIS